MSGKQINQQLKTGKQSSIILQVSVSSLVVETPNITLMHKKNTSNQVEFVTIRYDQLFT
jgi:hypothetical protein